MLVIPLAHSNPRLVSAGEACSALGTFSESSEGMQCRGAQGASQHRKRAAQVLLVIAKGIQRQAHLQVQVLVVAGPEEVSPAGVLWQSL